MSNLSNPNWNENPNGSKLGNPPAPRQASITSNPSNSNIMPPTPGSTGPHHPMPPHFATDYSRNVPVPGPGVPPFPLQQNQRAYLPNAAYTMQQSREKLQPGQAPLPQQQQQQQPMYHQYPPQPMGYLAADMYNNPQQQEYQQMNHLQNQQYNLQQRQQQQQEPSQTSNQKGKQQQPQQQQLLPQHPQTGAPVPVQQYPVAPEYNAAYQSQPSISGPPDHHQPQQHQVQGPPPQHWEGYPPQPQHGPIDSQVPPGQLQQQHQQQHQQQPSRQFPPTGQPPHEEKKRGRKPKSRKASDSGINTSHQLGGQVRSTSVGGTGKPVTKRSRMGCLTCRQRKKRCCETRPKCTECARLRLNCVWPKPGTEHKNKPKDQKEDENTIEHAEFGRIKVLRGIVEYRSK